MIKDILVGSAVAGLIIGVSPAFAGSYATNTYVDTVENGTRDINVLNIRNEKGHQITDSGSLKFETNFPNARADIEFNGTKLTGGIEVSTDGPDPFVEAVYSNQTEFSKFSDYTKVNIEENVDYTSNIYTHTIEAGGN